MSNELNLNEAIIFVVKSFKTKRHIESYTDSYFMDYKHAIWGLIKDCDSIMRVEMVKVLIGSREYNSAVTNSEREYVREYQSKTIVKGIVCLKCNTELPAMLMREHLDINNPKNKDCKCSK